MLKGLSDYILRSDVSTAFFKQLRDMLEVVRTLQHAVESASEMACGIAALAL